MGLPRRRAWDQFGRPLRPGELRVPGGRDVGTLGAGEFGAGEAAERGTGLVSGGVGGVVRVVHGVHRLRPVVPAIAEAGLEFVECADDETIRVRHARTGIPFPPPDQRGERAGGSQLLDELAISDEDADEKGMSTPAPEAAAFAVRAMVCTK